jgi:DNA-binding transcriptional ArsR family regulator
MTRQLQVVQQVSPNVPELTAKFFRGLGDSTRVRILHLLLEGDKNVGELVELVGSPQGRVSSHLACLRWCGYVTSYRDGKNVYYTLADPRVKDLLELAQQILTDNAERIIACQIIR